MIERVRHIGLVVSSLEVSLEFYKLLGFYEEKSLVEESEYISHVVGIDNVKMKWSKIRQGDYLVELIQYIRPQICNVDDRYSANRIGFSHMAFQTKDIEATVRKILDNGGSSISYPRINDENTFYVCYVRDPDGNIIELVQSVASVAR